MKNSKTERINAGEKLRKPMKRELKGYEKAFLSTLSMMKQAFTPHLQSKQPEEIPTGSRRSRGVSNSLLPFKEHKQATVNDDDDDVDDANDVVETVFQIRVCFLWLYMSIIMCCSRLLCLGMMCLT